MRKNGSLKILLFVGDANNVYVEYYSKWLKEKLDCTIDVIQVYNFSGKIKSTPYYDNLYIEPTIFPSILNRRFICRLKDIYQYFKIKRILKDKNYDICHCHWITGPAVLNTTHLRKHSKKLFATFWGGELEKQTIFRFNWLYRRRLSSFLQQIDGLINTSMVSDYYQQFYPFLGEKTYYASFGALGLDYLDQVLNENNKNKCKEYYGIPTNKICVQIGYSGKLIHNQLKIIKYLKLHPYLKDKIHLLNPMTRDGDDAFFNQVESALKESGYSYTSLYNRFLTNREVSILRYANDIVLQLSEFDQFSSSILEGFAAKNVVIYGNWLGYANTLQEMRLVGESVNSIEEGVGRLENVINNIDTFKNTCIVNSQSALCNKWENCIDRWICAYKL